MIIHYDSKINLLYIRLEPSKQKVTNIQVTEDIVLDIGEGDKIVGIEILDALKHVTCKVSCRLNLNKQFK
jgi:uncharacterized protein YuzE